MRRARPLTGASPLPDCVPCPRVQITRALEDPSPEGHSRLRRDFAFWDRRHGPVPPAVGRATYGERRDVHCSGKEESRVDAPGRQFRPLGARGCLASDPRTTRECFPCHEAWASRSDCDLPSMEVDTGIPEYRAGVAPRGLRGRRHARACLGALGLRRREHARVDAVAAMPAPTVRQGFG